MSKDKIRLYHARSDILLASQLPFAVTVTKRPKAARHSQMTVWQTIILGISRIDWKLLTVKFGHTMQANKNRRAVKI